MPSRIMGGDSFRCGEVAMPGVGVDLPLAMMGQDLLSLPVCLGILHIR